MTKKKVELVTKKQIETRVKRQVVLEDGKVVEDSGPIVTTNTTEDTEKQESRQTEVRVPQGCVSGPLIFLHSSTLCSFVFTQDLKLRSKGGFERSELDHVRAKKKQALNTADRPSGR